MIQEPWYAEHANMYLVVGTAYTILIDTGTGIGNVSQWLSTQGVVPDIVLTTHVHYDHCGGLHQFNPDHVYLTVTQAHNIGYSTLWGLHYFDSKHLTGEQSDVRYSYAPISPIGFQQLGERINLGNYQLDVLPFPGHTDDSIVLHEPNQQWLFTGDALYHGELYVDFPNTDMREWKKGLERLATFDLSFVFPGHNQILRGRDIDTEIRTTIDNKMQLW